MKLRPNLVKRLLTALLLIISLHCLAFTEPLQPVLVAPIEPMAYLLERVAGQDFTVRVLIPKGGSPHTFEITPRQMVELSGAKACFSLNMPLERSIVARLRAANPAMQVFVLNQNIAMRYFTARESAAENHGHEIEGRYEDEVEDYGAGAQPDPHTWLDPLNAIIQAENMAKGLSRLNPERQAYYQANLHALVNDLEELDRRLSRALLPYKGQSFLVYHPAFGYLARRYGLEQVAVEMEGKEPTPRALAQTLAMAKSQGIKVVFVQPHFPEAQATLLAEELGGFVVVLDPLAKDYILNLMKIVNDLTAEL